MVNGVEFKISIYKGSDIDSYTSKLRETDELSENLGVELEGDDIEFPKPMYGKGKFNPERIIYYMSSLSMEAGKKENPILDTVVFKYMITNDIVEEITVDHSYEEFEKILKTYYKNNEKNRNRNEG